MTASFEALELKQLQLRVRRSICVRPRLRANRLCSIIRTMTVTSKTAKSLYQALRTVKDPRVEALANIPLLCFLCFK